MTIRLDDQIAGGSLPVPDVVKIDIEVRRSRRRRGMRATLADHRPVVVVEVHKTLTPVSATLHAAGDGVTRLDPHEPDVLAHLLARWAGAPTSTETGTGRPPKV